MSLVVRFFYLKDWVLFSSIPCKQSGLQKAAMTPRTAGSCLVSSVDEQRQKSVWIDLKRAPPTPSSPSLHFTRCGHPCFSVLLPEAQTLPQGRAWWWLSSTQAWPGSLYASDCLLLLCLSAALLAATTEQSLAEPSFPGMGKCPLQYLSRYFLNTKYL